ncbi:MAG: hypothetical protein A2046_12340 [Bacteroidetes bacterium GWA2_30_7]|nr:MAG: hypothetical protein A2046_12340 [Bacteroidetes bacterium GWA2_30_7]
MANLKIVLNKKKKLKNNRFPIALRVTHERKQVYFSFGTDFNCSDEYWNDKKDLYFDESGIKEYNKQKKDNDKPTLKVFQNAKVLNSVLTIKLNEAREILLKYELEKIPFSFDTFKNDYLKVKSKATIFNVFDEVINELKNTNKIGYSNIFKSAKSSISDCFKKNDIKFRDVNYKFLNDYKLFLQAKGLKKNAIFVYFRTFRTLFNQAIKRKYADEADYPFLSRTNPNGFSLAKMEEATRKRSITKEQLILIRDYPTDENTFRFHAKNYFMFSFYLIGMNFKDIALLKNTNLVNGRIEYVRAKTNRHFSIKISNNAQEIIDYYKNINLTNDYIFPILSEKHNTPNMQYNRIKDVLAKMNQELNEIAKEVGIDFKITSYVARHSWATIQKINNTPISDIMDGMGHSTESQTHTYLNSIEYSGVDKYNENIL